MKALKINDIQKILSFYTLPGKALRFIPYGEGHINCTYLVTLNDKKHSKYILQVMNDQIFHPISHLMENYVAVTKHCHRVIKKQKGDPHRETINVVFTKNKQSYIKFKQNYCRILEYINHSYALQIVKKSGDFYHSAVAFANFYKLLADFDAEQLYEIIPNFHHTEKRYQNFLKAVKSDKVKRKKTCQKEIDFINKRKAYCSHLVKLLSKKELPLRVTHNDTKLNNILFDEKSKRPIAVIDLDTIMPGTICYDFGDAIRFGCNSANEDEKNLKKVYFRFDLYKLFLKGFLKTIGKDITKKEKENLALSSIIMTLECGMRFLTDYLEGDHYFHTKYATHNLVRCRTQLKLIEGMEKDLKKMDSLIKQGERI